MTSPAARGACSGQSVPIRSSGRGPGESAPTAGTWWVAASGLVRGRRGHRRARQRQPDRPGHARGVRLRQRGRRGSAPGGHRDGHPLGSGRPPTSHALDHRTPVRHAVASDSVVDRAAHPDGPHHAAPSVPPDGVGIQVTGTGQASLTVVDGANESQVNDVTLPWSTVLVDSPSSVNVSVQSSDGSETSTISCEIDGPGITPVSDSSSGPFATVSCGTTLGRCESVRQWRTGPPVRLGPAEPPGFSSSLGDADARAEGAAG